MADTTSSPFPHSTPLVVVTRTVPGRVLVPGFPEAQVRVLSEQRVSRAELLAGVRGAAGVVSMYWDKIDEEFLNAAGPDLRVVANFAVGYDNIDVAACGRRGVTVTNTPDAVTEGTANIAWALILAVARRLVEADRFARSPAYAEQGPLGINEFLGVDLTGRTLCIVGAGRIGYATAIRSIGWGMRVLYVARSRHTDFELAPLAARRVTLEEGLREADVVSVHTPLTPETRGLINRERLMMMKKNAILINTARGPVVQEAALVEALRERRIWGAGLDVFEFEPKVGRDLAALDNAVLTPHIGSAETRYRLLMTEMVGENIGAVLAGKEPPNRVR